MQKVLVDTDIILDLLAERKPFYSFAAQLFSMADKKEIKLFVPSLTFSNINYLLSRKFNNDKARKLLIQFKILITVLSVDDKIIRLALASEFKDFEDAIQYYCALENNIKILLTRNLKDYKKAKISILTAESFVKNESD